MSRVVAVGDIQGDYTWLADQLEGIELNYQDRVFFLGNHVGSAGQSAEVLQDLINIHPFKRTFHVAGHRDIEFRDWLMTGLGTPDKDVLDSYLGDVPYEHLAFLQGMNDKYQEAFPQVTYVFTHDYPSNMNSNNLYICSAPTQDYQWLDKNVLSLGHSVAVLDPKDYTKDFRRFNVYD